MRRSALVGMVVGLALGLAGQASAAMLYVQFPAAGSFTTPVVPSHDYSNDQFDAVAADDFQIGDGQVWKPEAVEVLGAAPQQDGSHTATVTVYADAGGAPGTPVFSQSGLPVPDCDSGQPCNFTAQLSNAPPLSPGGYWLSVQTAGDSPWWWQVHTPDATYGAPAVWQNPANGIPPGRNCLTWATLLDCQWTDATHGKDFIFALHGTLIDSRFSVGSFTTKRLKLFVNVNVPAAGRMAIGGKGVKKTSKQIGAGAQKIRVKLKKKVTKRLRRGKKAKLQVKLTFTATGGDAFTQATSVRLVPVSRARGLYRLAN